ncbi:MAG: hypothetical protein IT385_02145 [Deltaproteobacteria bacterium]|nr:hypothetical protein [Deltaproteobacteria bacterium]
MNITLSRGALTTGAVGGFLLGLSYLVLMLITSGSRDPSAMEGYLYLYGPLALVSSILLSVGAFASRKLFGGWQITAGIFAILAGIGGAGTLLIPLLVEFNSGRDAVLVSIISSSGTSLLFGLFASIANHKATADGRKAPAIVASGWLYGLGALACGFGAKFALREDFEMFSTLTLVATMLMCAATISHAVGLLGLGREPATAPRTATAST